MKLVICQPTDSLNTAIPAFFKMLEKKGIISKLERDNDSECLKNLKKYIDDNFSSIYKELYRGEKNECESIPGR